MKVIEERRNSTLKRNEERDQQIAEVEKENFRDIQGKNNVYLREAIRKNIRNQHRKETKSGKSIDSSRDCRKGRKER